MLKSNETWTLELENILLVTEKFLTSKESSSGFVYRDYLGILLLFEEDNVLAMRAMNASEFTIRQISGNQNFAMDSLLIYAEAEVEYKYKEKKIFTKRQYGY